jgi:hypothetical protein
MSTVLNHYENLPAEECKASLLRMLALFDKEFTNKKSVIGASAAALYIIDEVENNNAAEAKFTFTAASTANGEIGDWELIARKLS